jgi:D-lactate dehydrogenase
MKVALFSSKPYDEQFFQRENAKHGHELRYLEAHLSSETAALAAGADAVCAFVNDHLDAEVLGILANSGVRLLALRSAGFNHVDLKAAGRLGMTVARVPAYSPHAVAEHAIALLLSLNRKIHRAHARVREANFSLQGLIGFDLHGRTVGVIGTGKIGEIFARIMTGFGCRVLGVDKAKNASCRAFGVEYVSLDELFRRSDVISLHCPLNPETEHIINARALGLMKKGIYLINTGRGGLVDTKALLVALKAQHVGGVCLDVYEEEEELFFEDLSSHIIQDDVFMRLLTFPNVLITAHQGFFTEEALSNIAATTLGNITAFESGRGVLHLVPGEK